MRKQFLLVTGLLIACAANPLRADTLVNMTFNNGGPGYGGGAFNWTLNSVSGTPNTFKPLNSTGGVVSVGGQFSSFCIQTQEYVNNNATYNYTVITNLTSAPDTAEANSNDDDYGKSDPTHVVSGSTQW